MLNVQNLALLKSQRHLLADINLTLAEGQLLGVIGPNGAGKSSLLKTLAAIWKPTAGAATLDNVNITNMSLGLKSHAVAWLGQQNTVAFDFSVQQVLALGPQRGNRAVMAAAMQAFGVYELSARPMAELSGGQQQRVHLARVFSQLNASNAAAQCLMLDEPLNGLDLRWQQRCLQNSKQWLAQRAGRHAVMAIHDIGLAASFCDQVLVLNEGMIEFMGPPAELTENMLENVWRYPLAIQRGNTDNNNQTLVYAKAENMGKPTA